MSLSARLRDVDLTLECKYCGHPKIKKGGWFLVVPKFKCEKCKREVQITYKDKIALFDKHAHLA
jgi:transposase-like protein